MFTRSIAILSLVASVGFAEPPPPLPPPPQRNPVLDRAPRQPGVWEQIQQPLDRSTGRIVDEPTYQLDRWQRMRDERSGAIVPQREFDRLLEDRERQLRIENRDHQIEITAERRRQEELNRREQELLRRAAISSDSSQTMADEKSLLDARSARDAQTLTADRARSEAMRQRPGDREQIDLEYQSKVRDIRQRYDRERARILGVDPLPTTQPSP